MSTVSQQTPPISTAESDPWAPSMPNSDYYTLLSAKDAAELVVPKNQRGRTIIPRRVVAMRTSPLGRFPPVNAVYPPTYPPAHAPAYPAAYPAAAAPPRAPSVAVPVGVDQSSTSQTDVPASPEVPHQSPSRAIGLGHPSTSHTRNTPLDQDEPASPQVSPSPCTRIHSSTIQARTERSPARQLDAIVEDPVIPQPSATRPVPLAGTRKRSYAAAVSTEETAKKSTARRVTPTPPSSPRCASKPSGTSASSDSALAPRSTASGSPLAGPRQVQSPRLLFPVNMAGSPRFQSLDGAVLAITAAKEAVEQPSEKRNEDVEEEWAYREDYFIKFKVHATFHIRVAARRLKMLF
ncbi:hypothetical protein B0H17DRAFT_1134597 [Mycena rosella]|uniref:Uncharacterized protein n=1 Tax=Mycena rosella TaxID=1033263 RepID=A0AAD7DEZ8_MYCRO|nr:hypothetical protein B0H17DRAFT_1134597 [Mycena rosella]